MWDQPLFYELTSSKRRGKPGIVAHGFGVIGRAESSVGDVFGVVAEVAELAPGVHDLLGVVHLDDAVIVMWRNRHRARNNSPQRRRSQRRSKENGVLSADRAIEKRGSLGFDHPMARSPDDPIQMPPWCAHVSALGASRGDGLC